MEEYKDIIGYEGVYQVSNKGNIRTLERPVYKKDGRLHYIQKSKILKKSLFKNGYYYVSLHKKGSKTKVKTIHSLVAEHFINNTNQKAYVNHIDGDKLNNDVTNLEWSTPTENNNHALDTGLRKRYSLLATSISDGGSIYFENVKQAEAFGFLQSQISSCIKGKYKSHKGFTWKYVGESSKSSKDKDEKIGH